MKTYYPVEGSVRGDISIKHRSLDAAIRGYQRDHSACRSLGGGAYSDVRIYKHVGDEVEPMVNVGEDDEPRWLTNEEADAWIAVD